MRQLHSGLSRVSREFSIPLYLLLVRLHLEYKVTFQTPQYKKDIDILEQGWWKATNMKRGLEYTTHEERLRETVCSALRRGGVMGILLLSSFTQQEGTAETSQALPRDAQQKHKRQCSQIAVKKILTKH